MTVDGISDIRLNVPRLVTYSDFTRSLVQSVYIKGIGKFTISGHWADLSLPQGQQDIEDVTGTIDLSTGGWKLLSTLQDVANDPILFPGHHIPRIGNHAIQFIIDSPATTPVTATSVEDVAITGFVPGLNGWFFNNGDPKYTVPQTTSSSSPDTITYPGLCEGMIESVRDRYDSIQDSHAPVWPTNTTQNRIIYPLLKYYFDAGNKWSLEPKRDLDRIKNALSYPFDNTTYISALKSEAGKIRDQIAAGDPCDIGLYTLFDLNHANAHSVLGIASFVANNVYDSSGTGRELKSMNLFSIYDPNRHGDNNRYVVAFDTGYDIPQFTFIPADLGYNYVLWNQTTFHTNGKAY